MINDQQNQVCNGTMFLGKTFDYTLTANGFADALSSFTNYILLFILHFFNFYLFETRMETAMADINCYVCDATDPNALFQCGEWFDRYDTPQIHAQNCSGVHGARYCIKHIGRFEGTFIE